MLQITRFDIKTGKLIKENLAGSRQPAVKLVEHAYLEHWLATNNINAQFSVAKFYESVNDSDRLRLEPEDKVLAFSSGSEGYFTDPMTAQLMVQGSEVVTPIYANDHNSPHNSVAYGGLIASDGLASTTIQAARILVIDDERRAHGNAELLGRNGQPIPKLELEMLYDKMGDGTMLVSTRTMQLLQTTEETEKIAIRSAEKAGLSDDIGLLAREISQLEQAADKTTATIQQQGLKLARRSVYQFRAASPDLPGIAKGTMASSYWCDRLGVDAIISSNDIKGDDGRLAEPGIKEISNLWINRKAIAQYGQQSVGPQVKYTIPEATRLEINPKVQAQAEELAQVTGDFAALSQRYVEQKEKERSRPYQNLESDTIPSARPDWLYDALSADKYGQLTDQANVVRGLSRYVRGEWKRLAISGTSVPSAMAQHHGQLKPWEICNKDLPHGAIVTYYRSPFPNVGAAALAINNTEVIKEQDREAFSKQGIAYLPPWTAKNVAITDFDGDMNGFFVGYQATVSDLPQQIRSELASVESLPPSQQYEASRALFEQMVRRLERGQESRIFPSEFPLAVKEFIGQNAPAVKPPEIIKQTKEKHPWPEGQSHAAATWQAWGITADNPTGQVANAGMTLQSYAIEMRYASAEKKEALLKQVSGHCRGLLAKADREEMSIPDDDWLDAQGFSPFYKERIETIAGAGSKLGKLKDSQQREQFIKQSLQDASNLFSEVANGPNAVNLQTAVDMAKSAKGIDKELHKFVEALQYKPDILRQSKNEPDVYVGGKKMLTNTEDPVAWGIQSVNTQYSDAQLEERLHQEFHAVFPKTDNAQHQEQSKTIVRNYNGLMKKAVTSKNRQRQRRAEDQRPTLRIGLPNGRSLTLQDIKDEQGKLPIWRAQGPQPNWKIRVKQDHSANPNQQFPVQLVFIDDKGMRQAERIGYVSPESAIQQNLAQKFDRPGQKVSVAAPIVTTQVPWAQQNDTDMLFEEANRYLESAIAPPIGKDLGVHREEMAISLWRQSDGRKIVMQQYPDILSDRLQQFTTRLTQVQQAAQLAADGLRTVQFTTHEFTNKTGEQVMRPSVEIAQANGEFRHLGYVASRERVLPPGATFMAVFDHQGFSNEQVVQIELMDLSAVEQTQAEVAAFSDGRSHLTFDYESHAAYGVREGDIVIAQAQEGGEQVALRVGSQHPIDARLAATAGAAQRWADLEKSSPSALLQKVAAAHSEDKSLWGLNVEPLGTYRQGQITPFSMPEQNQQLAASQAVKEPIIARQEFQEKPIAFNLYERYSSKHRGVLAAVAASNPKLQQQLDRSMAERAITDGQPIEAVQEAIAQHSPAAQEGGQPDVYAKSVVGQVKSGTAKAANVPLKQPAKAQTQSRHPPKQAKTKAKDNGMSY